MDYLSIEELCSMLCISAATGRNWIKAGRLTPQKQVNRSIYFSREYAESVQRRLRDEKSTVLKSRRNKKYISGSSIYHSYVSNHSAAQIYVQSVLDYIQDHQITLGESEISALTAECAVRLLLLRGNISLHEKSCLKAYLSGSIHLNGYEFLIDDLICDRDRALSFVTAWPDLFKIEYLPANGRQASPSSLNDSTGAGASKPARVKDRDGRIDDVLGLLFISVSNPGSRKAMGSYFTPAKVVDQLYGKLFEKNISKGRVILDPCCGTGSFLLRLPDEIRLENVYGNDIDALSVKIARINLAMRFGVKDRDLLVSHITNENYLNHHWGRKFDFILGNPPWGYEFSKEEKELLRDRYVSASGRNIESYDVFVEQALNDLSERGVLSFVLPEAILNAKTHMPVRNILSQRCTFQYLSFLGNAFNQVQCPCIILQVRKNTAPVFTGSGAACNFSAVNGSGAGSGSRFSGSYTGMEINDGRRNYHITRPREITPECFSFLTTDEEYSILQKISDPAGKCFLAGNAVFALGIVTGNNRQHITSEKKHGSEMILRGSDLRRYHFRPSSDYILFQPEVFQQSACVDYYRAKEKLFYRFICRQLVFAYDDRQTLSLNSCNIVIPQIEGLSVKYILTILNSRTAQFYFRKTFNSVKVLRSHIEQIPVPFITKKQQEPFLACAEMILAEHDSVRIRKLYDDLDAKIAALYKLTATEYAVISDSMAGENLFLT